MIVTQCQSFVIPPGMTGSQASCANMQEKAEPTEPGHTHSRAQPLDSWWLELGPLCESHHQLGIPPEAEQGVCPRPVTEVSSLSQGTCEGANG